MRKRSISRRRRFVFVADGIDFNKTGYKDDCLEACFKATDINAAYCIYELSAGVLLKATLGRATYVLIRSVKTNKALLLTEVK